MRDEPFASSEEIEAYLAGDIIECLICGRRFRNLAGHVVRAHEMSAREYRNKYGIPAKFALCGQATSAILASQLQEMIVDGTFVPEPEKHREEAAEELKRLRQAGELPCLPPSISEKRLRHHHAQGETDAELARSLGVSKNGIKYARENLGLPANRKTTRPPRLDLRAQRTATEEAVVPLLNDGISDRVIADRLGITREYVSQIRKSLGMPPIDRQPIDEQEFRALYDEGKSDAEIAAVLGASKSGVGEFRRRQGLPSQRDRQK